VAGSSRKPAPFPSREQILDFVRDTPGNVGKREIARAFRLDAAQKRELKTVLKQLEADGLLGKRRGRRYAPPEHLPNVAVIEVTGLDADGDPMARPLNWESDNEPPAIYVAAGRDAAPGRGDRLLVQLTRLGDGTYEARTIRRLSSTPVRVIGIFDVVDGEPRIRPTSRRQKGDLIVRTGETGGAEAGDLVRAEVMPGHRLGLRQARVVERLDAMDEEGSISLIAIHDHDIPTEFPPEAIDLAAAAGPAELGKREDLRSIPLVTIDGADARDFDDAVWAEPDDDPANTGGWHLLVAIADVAWYVRPGDALDREAKRRGNSVYFPDRVEPMLPEALSNGWCSLVPGEDRPCLAAHLWINADGRLIRHHFLRGLMRSAARLTYEDVQAARDGEPADNPVLDTVIDPLYGAYECLEKARRARHALDLEVPEKRIVLGDDGEVASIGERERLDSHKLIEEFMITANIAAAETLEKLRQPCMYRIHDQPSLEKIQALSDFLESLGIRFAKGQVVKPERFNTILHKVAATPQAHVVNQIVLRTQSQAEYAPENIGHFGLALAKYSHFTSPIRRYADLLVHRALIEGARLGGGGLGDGDVDFEAVGEHISMTERRAAAAERDAVDRYMARHLATKVGAVFEGRISGVTRFGLFVTLDESGADGLVPVSSLPEDYYRLDESRHCLVGRYSGQEYHLGEAVTVRLQEASPITGGLIFAVMGGLSSAHGSTNRKPGGRGYLGRRGRKPVRGRKRK